LAPREAVPPFGAGRWPGPTTRVLDALKHECVHATFFLLGRNAAASPQLARRIVAEGHTVAHHTWSHRLLNRLPLAAAQEEIDRGMRAVDAAAYGGAGSPPHTPFFRFPGFAASPSLLSWLEQRGIVVFGADLWASDWNPMAPGQELRLVLGRIEALKGGIVLLHDVKAQTAALLHALLRELKERGVRVVPVLAAA